MNALNEKVIQWSEENFDLKIPQKDLQNLLHSKNGKLYKKLFLYMSDQIRSKEDGNQIKRFCESVKLQHDLKTMNEEFNKIAENVTKVCDDLAKENHNRRRLHMEETLNKKRAIVSSLIVNAIEKIAAKDKKDFLQFEADLTPINRIADSYLNRLAPIDINHIDVSGGGDSDTSKKSISKTDIEEIWERINELVSQIGSVLYHLSRVEIQKPIKQKIDIAAIDRCLVELKLETKARPKTKNEFEVKRRAVAQKLENVNNLLNKYQTKRLEKLSKHREKLEKVINTCDEFIQTKRLKCYEKSE